LEKQNAPPDAARAETAHPRLARMRFLGRLLDNSILLPGGFRIGLDPIIGLLPGIGDLIGSLFSFWLIYEAARLGIKKRHLLRMVLNVIIETAAGSIPLLGDLFDAAWKANAKNVQITENNFHPGIRPRSLRKIIFAFAAILLGFYSLLALLFYLMVRGAAALFS
jgi:hypothetical protein